MTDRQASFIIPAIITAAILAIIGGGTMFLATDNTLWLIPVGLGLIFLAAG